MRINWNLEYETDIVERQKMIEKFNTFKEIKTRLDNLQYDIEGDE